MDAQERENALSVRRSTVAAYQDGPAGETATPESVRNVISSPGQSLDASIKRAMEDRMGDTLGDVRIHTGPSAAKACEDINARAFTVGNHVAFNTGEYDPLSPDGQHVLAHELAHVRQQTGGAVSMLPQENVGLEIDPDPQLEREAEETAQRVLEGGELGIQRMGQTDVHVQRHPIYGPRPGASHGETVTDVAALEDDLEVAGEMSKAVAKTFLKRFIPNEVIAAYDAKKEAEEPSFQDKLQNARFPSGWVSDLGDFAPPSEWTEKFRQVAVKAARDETGSGGTKF
ncbi:eCIS core domain-containing protein [Natrinema gari]|nr:DUF4157 domain-containing protein [Natrinema gari]